MDNVFDYIEVFYNRTRLYNHRDGVSPKELHTGELAVLAVGAEENGLNAESIHSVSRQGRVYVLALIFEGVLCRPGYLRRNSSEVARVNRIAS
ncbi:hypothetical protein JOE11_005525 [Robbsia andropogonis]